MTPEISVVIPTRGSSTLAHALSALFNPEDPPAYEVHVVADADAPEVLAATLRAQRPGASAARNAGLRAARAPIVLFLGDDIFVPPDLLRRHVERHRGLPAQEVAVLGHVRWHRSLKRTPLMAWLDRGIQTDYGAIEGDRAGWGHFYTTNVSVKRDFALSVGGFDEDIPFLYEDLDFARRLHDRGLDLRYDPAIVAEHFHEPTLAGWRARMEAVGRMERAFVAKHPDFQPYFFERLGRAAGGRRAHGLAARLAHRVPPHTPVLGPRVWASAEAYFGQQLWPAFKRGWDAAA